MTVYIFPPFNIVYPPPPPPPPLPPLYWCLLFLCNRSGSDKGLDYIPDFEVGFSLAVMTRLALSLLMLCHYDQ